MRIIDINSVCQNRARKTAIINRRDQGGFAEGHRGKVKSGHQSAGRFFQVSYFEDGVSTGSDSDRVTIPAISLIVIGLTRSLPLPVLTPVSSLPFVQNFSRSC